MIQLERAPKPTKLTQELQEKLTQKFIDSNKKKSVWKRKFLLKALLKISHGKCCYCECNITEESKYMEVEHFHPKSLYPQEVIEWNNLLPACKRCNGKKGNHDTKAVPIINPVNINPKGHLTMKTYRMYGKTKLGEETKGLLDLNDRKRLVIPRFNVGDKITEKLEGLLEWVNDIESELKNNPVSQRRAVNTTEKLLIEATPPMDYCATAAHVIIFDPNFQEIKKKMTKLNLWNDSLQDLENIARKYALDKK